jgi:hypothetical protein
MTDPERDDHGFGEPDTRVPPAAQPAGPVTSPPPNPAPGSGVPPTPGWKLPDASAGPAVRLDLPLVVGRTFDTLGREWSLFLALAIPAAIGGFISGVLSPSLPALLRDGRSTEDQVASMALQAVVAIFGGVTTLGTIVAADGLWRGSSVGLGDAFGRAMSILPRVIALFIVVLLATVGIAVALAATVLVLQSLGPVAGGVGAVAVLALLVVAIYVSARLSLILPVLVLEDTPVIASVARAWRITRGNALALFGIAFVIALCGILPTWGAILFDMFVDNRLVAGIALGLGTMVVAPLGGIWTVIGWGMLTGAPFHDSEVMTTGRGRTLGFLIIATVGLVLVVVGAGLGAVGAAEVTRLSEGI